MLPMMMMMMMMMMMIVHLHVTPNNIGATLKACSVIRCTCVSRTLLCLHVISLNNIVIKMLIGDETKFSRYI